MDADEDRVARAVGDLCSHFQWDEIISLPSHDHVESFRLQDRSELSRHIQSKIFFRPVSAHLPLVMATVTRIENNGLNLTDIWNAMRSNERLEGFGHIRPRHQRFPIVFNHRKAQPAPS